MIRFGRSALPDGDDDAAFLDAVVARGEQAVELAFTKGFPWDERRCRRFAAAAAERGVAVSLHAPYFAVLTVGEPDKRATTLAAVEHSMKLGKALGATVVVAHAGYLKDRSPEVVQELVVDGLERIEPKVAHLGVGLGLETAGNVRGFGSLGDIALLARRFRWVRPVVDWAHVHAMSGGGLTTEEAFSSVIAFLRSEFAGWTIDPLHTQFSDNEFGPGGEIRHVPYGEGTLRIEPLVAAAIAAGVRLDVISEARDDASHDMIHAALRAAEGARRADDEGPTRPIHSGRVAFEDIVDATPAGGAYSTVGLARRVKLTNPDKAFFPGAGYTKGDVVQYYGSVARWLLPHLAGRALSMSRYPDGVDGPSFYEKQCPSHAPEWLVRAPLHSDVRGGAIDFCTAPDRESLLWVANLGCIEMHPWLSRVQHPDLPDFAVFDLDPQEGASWEQVTYVAGLVNVVLERLGLAAYPKTSGATGLHVYVPLEPRHDYRRVREFVGAVGRMIVSADPDTVTMEWDVPKRGPRVFIDVNQNVAGKTIASVYSLRPRPGATVSTPVGWDEIASIRPEDFTIATIWPRLRRLGDLFAPVLAGGQVLDGAESALGLRS